MLEDLTKQFLFGSCSSSIFSCRLPCYQRDQPESVTPESVNPSHNLDHRPTLTSLHLFPNKSKKLCSNEEMADKLCQQRSCRAVFPPTHGQSCTTLHSTKIHARSVARAAALLAAALDSIRLQPSQHNSSGHLSVGPVVAAAMVLPRPRHRPEDTATRSPTKLTS